MNYPPYNPSYYRSHLYAHQNNLPDSAFNNRRLPLYSSQMPQGVDPFLPSHKKHFQRAGYRSVITEEHIINHQSPEEADSPAKNKDYYRNLSIEDIEGASPNTLISQAIKNRIKAKEHLLRKQRNQQSQAMMPKEEYYSPIPLEKQEEAVKLIQRYKKEENYHQRNRAIKTQGNDETSHFRIKLESDRINEYKSEIEQTQKEIQDLQRRLDFAKQKVQKEKMQGNFQQKIQQNQRQKTTSVQAKPTSGLKLPKITHPQQLDLMIRPSESSKGNRKRSYTQPEQVQGFSYPQKDKIVENRPQYDHSERLQQSRIRRQQIRKMNPTYLSYGSSSINPKRVYL